MNLMAKVYGQKAYNAHIKVNQLLEKKRFDEAMAKQKEALELYEKAVEAGQQPARILMAYGVLLLKAEAFDKARDLMLKTEKVSMTPDEKNQLRLNFAVCQWKLGKLDSAIEQMKRVAQDGKTSTIYGSLGYMLIEKAIQTGDFSEAIAFNDEAYEYDDEDAVVLDNLGQLNLAMGEREKALDYFKRAIARKETQVDTLYSLAKMAYEDGDRDAARAYIQRALAGNYSALCVSNRRQAEELAQKIG